MYLFSIFICDDDPGILPAKVEENIASFKHHHPSGQHHIFDRKALRHLLAGEFGDEVLAAFDALKPYAYKADMAKYCLLYHFGGVYADLSYNFQNQVPRTEEKLSVFRDFTSCSTWDTSVGVIAAPPRHPAMKLAIRYVCENVRTRHLGVNALCPTGPTLFGKAVAMACQPEDIVVGQAVWQPQEPPNGPLHVLMNRGLQIAHKTKVGGGPMTELGIHKGNAYNEFWSGKDVYHVQKERRRSLFERFIRRRGTHQI